MSYVHIDNGQNHCTEPSQSMLLICILLWHGNVQWRTGQNMPYTLLSPYLYLLCASSSFYFSLIFIFPSSCQTLAQYSFLWKGFSNFPLFLTWSNLWLKLLVGTYPLSGTCFSLVILHVCDLFLGLEKMFLDSRKYSGVMYSFNTHW